MDDIRHNPTARPPDPAGAPHSAEEVFHEYAPRVYNLARRMLSSDADAEDVTQDVLLQVVRKLPTFRGESAFPTWLHRVTVNAALAHRRKRATRQQHQAAGPVETYLEDSHHHFPNGPMRQWSVAPEQAVLDAETHASAGTRSRLIRRVVTAVQATRGPGWSRCRAGTPSAS